MTTHDPRGKLHYPGIVRVPVVAVTLIAASGCLIVPKTSTSERVIAKQRVDLAPTENPPLQLELASKGLRITMRAIAPRVCTSESWQVVETTKSKRAGLYMLDDSGWGNMDAALLVGLILAPVTLTVSGMITAVTLAASDDQTTRERRKSFTWQYDCSSIGAGLAVALTLPSGAVTEVMTGSDGRAYFDVPFSEAEEGVVAVQLSGLAARELRYCRMGCPPQIVATRAGAAPKVGASTDRATCLKQRSDLMLRAQQVADLKERARQLMSLPVCVER
jgi:hypothetical protein